MAKPKAPLAGARPNLATDMLQRAKKGPKGAAGPIKGNTGGRADKRPVDAPEASYVIPADVVSALGEGNTDAGQQKLFGRFPGSKPLKRSKPIVPKAKFADGGNVPIVVSDGEFIISPEDVTKLGGGDVSHGHDILDNFVKQTRAQNIQRLQAIPAPKGS